MAKGFIIAAPYSKSGKSIITMALLRSFKRHGLKMSAGKVGPDYIDSEFHAKSINDICYNYDLWGMNSISLNMIEKYLINSDMIIIEGVLGLFDGPIKGIGSTADVSSRLNLPIVLVIDARSMGQSVAALVYGFIFYKKNIKIGAIIFNNVNTEKHRKILLSSVKSFGIPVAGCLSNNKYMLLKSCHLGLLQANKLINFENFINKAADYIEKYLDINLLKTISCTINSTTVNSTRCNINYKLKPLGQKIAIAKDAAFTFIYSHIIAQWRCMGAEINYFSPLNNELPDIDVNAVYLPGGYPEFFAKILTHKNKLRKRLKYLSNKNVIIYGECGGYMVMGKGLIDKNGKYYKMFDLLNLVTSFEYPKLQLGYLKLQHNSQLPWDKKIFGHEFHYTHTVEANGIPLFKSINTENITYINMGLQNNSIMGSYAHVIDVKDN